jgi:fucose 4-O-acetylase-like acetyltransferase
MFHMPAFFVISGWTTSLQNKTLFQFSLDKFGTILLPCIATNLLFIFLLYGLSKTACYTLFYAQAIELKPALIQFSRSEYLTDLGGATWFLIVIFETCLVARIMAAGANRLNLPCELILPASLLLLVFGYSLYQQKTGFPYLFDLSLSSLFYFMLGNALGSQKMDVPDWLRWSLLPLSLGVLLYYYGYHPDRVIMNWPARMFGTPLDNILASFAGSYLLYGLSVGISKLAYIRKIFSYIGRRTLMVLTLHFLVFRICYGLFYLLGMAELSQLQRQILDPGNPHWLILAAMTLTIIMGMDYLIRKNAGLKWLLLGGELSKLQSRRVSNGR